MKSEIVKSRKEMKSLINKGIVEPCVDTLTKIEGLFDDSKFTCYYVFDVVRTIVGNVEYSAKYKDGCFYPYVLKTYLS